MACRCFMGALTENILGSGLLTEDHPCLDLEGPFKWTAYSGQSASAVHGKSGSTGGWPRKLSKPGPRSGVTLPTNCCGHGRSDGQPVEARPRPIRRVRADCSKRARFPLRRTTLSMRLCKKRPTARYPRNLGDYFMRALLKPWRIGFPSVSWNRLLAYHYETGWIDRCGG